MWAAIFGQPHDYAFAESPEQELCRVLVACPPSEAFLALVAQQASAVRSGGYPCERAAVPATAGSSGTPTHRPPLRRAMAADAVTATSSAWDNVMAVTLGDR